MESPFGIGELKDVIWNCAGNKSPRLDGFNMVFYKACWDIVKTKLFEVVKEFFWPSRVPKAITILFLALIPKIDIPQSLDEFMPICLVGSLYIIIFNILASRLKLVIRKLISRCQTTFVTNMKLMDGVFVLNETVDFSKRNNRSCMLVKIDFENTYMFLGIFLGA